MDKLIINAALTGMVPTKADNPHVPIALDEIVADALRCSDAGAGIVHLHARDAAGQPTYKKEIYGELMTRIRTLRPDLLISGSTSGRVFKEFWQRAEVLSPAPNVQPDFGSLTLGSLNFPNETSVNTPDMIRSLATAMNARGIVPEWEVFDLGMIDYAHYLIQRGVLIRPYYCNILLGSLGALSATPYNLVAMVRALGPDAVWSATGIGRYQFFVNAMAVTMGGHVRVGLEDNLYDNEGRTKFATNAGLIERIVNVARAVGREIASPDEARRLIGLAARPPSPA